MSFRPLTPEVTSSSPKTITLTGEAAELYERLLPLIGQCLASGHYTIFAGIVNGEDIDILGIHEQFPVEDSNRLLVRLEEVLIDHAIQVTSPPKEKTLPNPID
jgi:hypothetical protein